jgi:hypothetical protein
MTRRGLRVIVLLALAGVICAFLAADLLRWMKPSALSAMACTTTLFRGKTDAAQLLARYRQRIIEQAALHDLPAVLVAAVLVDHQNQQTSTREFTDCFGSALGANLSLGLAQMRIGTAAQLDGLSLPNLTAVQFRELRARLRNPDLNIAYEARELRALMERAIRYPGMSAAALLQDPAAMALLVSEYRGGRQPTTASKSRLTINAFTTLDLMRGDTLSGFDTQGEDPAHAKELIREYLNDIYCHSEIFNESACQRWQQRLQSRQAESITSTSEKPD